MKNKFQSLFTIKNIKKLGQVFYWVVFIILLSIAAFTALSSLDLPNNYQLLIVQSGSMEPSIHTGSVVVVKPVSEYVVGDIITFHNQDSSKETTTHRIFGIQEDDQGNPVYVTKGDANDAPDGRYAYAPYVIGKVFFSIPLIGYLVAFAKTLPGLIMLIIIPAVIIVYSEVLTIGKEIKNLFSRMKKLDTEVSKLEHEVEELIEIEEKDSETKGKKKAVTKKTSTKKKK